MRKCKIKEQKFKKLKQTKIKNYIDDHWKIE